MTVRTQRIAIVSGGSGGIGAAVCKRLCADGCIVGVGYSAHRAVADAVCEDSAGLPGRCSPVHLDLTAESPFDALDRFVSEFGAITIAVAAAGILRDAPIAFHSTELVDNLLTVNLTGAMRLFQAVLPGMKRGADGRLIAIASAAGDIGAANRAAYSASKAALTGLIRSLAKEYGFRGVTANIVSPGLIETPMIDAMTAAQRDRMLETALIRRIGTPDDVANATAFLASTASSYITGQVLRVDGGMTL